MKRLFASKQSKILLAPVLALSITLLTGLIPLAYSSFESQGYRLCGAAGFGFPIPWVNPAGSSGYLPPLGYVCRTNVASYNLWILGLDSLLITGVGYAVLFMPRTWNSRLFVGLSAAYLGFFTTLSMIFINPHSLPFADLLWNSLATTSLAPWADLITTLFEWCMMAVLALVVILVADMARNSLSHTRLLPEHKPSTV